MKKLTLITLFAAAATFGYAQDGNNICTWNAMNTYNSGGGPDDLEQGIKCTDEAAANESTINKSKTWFYRGQLYTLIAQDKVLNLKYGTAALEAVMAFKKLYEIGDPKFKDWEDVFKYLMPLATNTFNTAVDNYQNKNYAQAFQFFYAIKDINAVIEGKGKKANIDLAVALKNAAICAENAGDVEGAIKVYKDWLAVAPDAVAYRSYAVALKKSGSDYENFKKLQEGKTTYNEVVGLFGNVGELTGSAEGIKTYTFKPAKGGSLLVTFTNDLLSSKVQTGLYAEGGAEASRKIVDEGLAKYPKDANLLVEKINVYLEDGKYPEALAYVNNLLDVEPNNDGALFIKGLAYEKIGNEDSVVYYYNRSGEANPKNIKPWNNLGALYVNKANSLVEQMNKLGNTSADIKKYDELKKERTELYKKAKPYLEKAKEIDPSDAQINRTLKQVELYTAE